VGMMRCVSVESVRQLETSHDTGWAKKRGHRLITIILSNLNGFKTFLLLEDSLVNLQINAHFKSLRTLHMLLHYLVKH